MWIPARFLALCLLALFFVLGFWHQGLYAAAAPYATGILSCTHCSENESQFPDILVGIQCKKNEAKRDVYRTRLVRVASNGFFKVYLSPHVLNQTGHLQHSCKVKVFHGNSTKGKPCSATNRAHDHGEAAKLIQAKTNSRAGDTSQSGAGAHHDHDQVFIPHGKLDISPTSLCSAAFWCLPDPYWGGSVFPPCPKFKFPSFTSPIYTLQPPTPIYYTLDKLSPLTQTELFSQLPPFKKPFPKFPLPKVKPLPNFPPFTFPTNSFPPPAPFSYPSDKLPTSTQPELFAHLPPSKKPLPHFPLPKVKPLPKFPPKPKPLVKPFPHVPKHKFPPP